MIALFELMSYYPWQLAARRRQKLPGNSSNRLQNNIINSIFFDKDVLSAREIAF